MQAKECIVPNKSDTKEVKASAATAIATLVIAAAAAATTNTAADAAE